MMDWPAARPTRRATKLEGFQANRYADTYMPCRDTNACASPSDIRTVRQANPRGKTVTKLTPDQIRWAAGFTGVTIKSDQSPALNQGPRAAATSLKADSQQVEPSSASLSAAPIQQGLAAGLVAGGGKNGPGEKPSHEASGDKPGAKGEKEEGSGDSGVAVAVFKFLVSKSGDVTLKAPESGSAMPEGKTANDFTWKGPIATNAVYDEKTLFANIADWIGLEGEDRIAYAVVEVSFYYSGKYINGFHAKLTDAKLDKLADLDCELAVDDSNVGNSPDHIAHIDWTVTFRRRHPLGSAIATVTGRASGDGTYTTSQPAIIDFVKESIQQQEAIRARNK
jgi:hypothetical protein